MALKKGISGLRGTVHHDDEEQLLATTVVNWSQAFVALLQEESGAHPLIALGHDARRSSPAIAALVRGGLLAAGADVVDLGLTLTPTVQHAVRNDIRVDGGVMITASHNPVIWNGLKFLNREGLFLPPDAWDVMERRVRSGKLPAVPLDLIGRVEQRGELAWQAHKKAILSSLPREMIRRKRYRVALDACNGGAVRWAEALQELGCDTILLHSEQHGFFAREAEPLPAHLESLSQLVRAAQCDLGLAADPDGDRLVLVDARGEAVNEEYTVVLAAMAAASEEGDRVAVNVVTTHAIEEVLPHASVLRTAVGEMNVVNGALESGAVIGGEGSGGIIVPRMNLARDGLAAAGLILALLATRDTTLQDVVARIPRWRSIKSKLTATAGSPDTLRSLFARWKEEPPELRLEGNLLRVGSVEGSLILEASGRGELRLTVALPGGAVEARGESDEVLPLFVHLAAQNEGVSLDLTDGIKVSSDNAWLSLRPSNTEPIVRVMGEVRVTESVL